MDWIAWVFSGVGVAAGAAIISWAWRRYQGQNTNTTAGARISGSSSRTGGAWAQDETGKGAVIEDTQVEEDLIASSSSSQDTTPKA